MQVLRRRGLHPRAETRGHDDGGEVSHGTGAPGFEAGIAGPKPAALPLGYAPPLGRVSPNSRVFRDVFGRRSKRQVASTLMIGAASGASALGYAPPLGRVSPNSRV